MEGTPQISRYFKKNRLISQELLRKIENYLQKYPNFTSDSIEAWSLDRFKEEKKR